MALDPQSYGASEFRMAFKREGNIGTALVTTMQLMDIDVPLSFPDLNPVMDISVRSGEGRTKKTADVFVCKKGTLKNIPFSGIADKTVLPILVQNVLTQIVGVSPASYDAPYNYTPPSMAHGDAVSDDTKTFTVAAPISPESSQTVVFSGCTIPELVITVGSIDDRNGQAMFSGSFDTRYLPSHAQATPSSMSVYGTSYYYLTDFTTTKTFAGKNNVVLDGLTITISNPSRYEGFQGANGDPETISRAVGDEGLSIKVAGTIKYDNNTAGLFADYENGVTNASIELSNHGTWSSATGFGLKADAAVIESVAFNDKNSMYLDVSLILTAGTSGDMLQLIL